MSEDPFVATIIEVLPEGQIIPLASRPGFVVRAHVPNDPSISTWYEVEIFNREPSAEMLCNALSLTPPAARLELDGFDLTPNSVVLSFSPFDESRSK